MLEFAHYYFTLPAGGPTQGDLWVNLPCSTLPSPYAAALIVTPRCDFAHDKTPVLNFIPAVSLSFFVQESIPRLVDRELTRLENQLHDLDIPCAAYGMLEVGATPGSVRELLLEQTASMTLSKRSAGDLQKFLDTVDQIEGIRRILASNAQDSSVLQGLLPPRELTRFREQILRNQINDVHMLPPCVGASHEPLVLLLRHISSCDIRCVQLAHSCVTSGDWTAKLQSSLQQFPALAQFLEKPERIARLKSPFIEHVMSRFSALFMRVGVPDLTPTELSSLINNA